MKNATLLTIAIALISMGNSYAGGKTGICTKTSCAMKSNSAESFTIAYKHSVIGFDKFILPNSQKAEFMNDQMNFNDKTSYGFLIRGMAKEKLGIRLAAAKETIDYSITGRNYGEAEVYRAERTDASVNIGIEKHWHVNRVLRVYVGPNIPIKLNGKAKTDNMEVTEHSARQGSIGGGLAAGLYCKVLKVITIGADMEGYAIPTSHNLEIADEFIYQKFTNIGMNANLTLGLAF